MIFLLLLLCALFGHAVLWTTFVNRLHASAVPHRIVNPLSYAALAVCAAIPLGFASWMWRVGMIPDWGDWGSPDALWDLPFAWLFYLVICWIMAAIGFVGWVARQMGRRAASVECLHDSRSICLADKSRRETVGRYGGDYHHHPLLRLPGNQSLRIDIVERQLVVDRLHRDLDGLSIVHLSDLHFSGRIGKGYFEEIVRVCNELQPALVAITGDLVEKARFIDWIPDTLGKLQARCGVFYVLGNHDLRVDVRRLRATLKAAGLIDLGGRWLQICVGKHDGNFHQLPCESDAPSPGGCPIVLAGNELPWFPPAAEMRTAPPRLPDGQPLRVLLSHSPDQIDWATAADVDLMLAGHLHGGQFCLPFIGPVLSPSRSGVKYASGVHYSQPTLLHVSRGVSAKLPLRLNCEPELARLVLHCP